MKTKFIRNTNCSVTVETDDIETGDRIEQTYYVRSSTGRGYVRDSRGRQVCHRMGYFGSTLSCSQEHLLDCIKSEWRKAVYDESKEYGKTWPTSNFGGGFKSITGDTK